MKQCDDFRSRLTLYLDNELQGTERHVLEAHLEECAPCRITFENDRSFIEKVRESAPLHRASPELRSRVQDVLSNSPAIAPTDGLRVRVQRIPWPQSTHSRRLRQLAALAVLAILVTPLAVSYFKKPSETTVNAPSEFALMAADTHLRRTRGQLPLELSSDAPAQISNWFANKVTFSVQLPNYQEASGQEKLYRLEGARLVGYKNDYAAYVAYQMKTRPISLVITSDTLAQPTGGEQIKARGLTFHYNAIHGLKVLTWSDRGLTYALVSDLEERGQQSCVVCHQGTKDQHFIEPLKPR